MEKKSFLYLLVYATTAITAACCLGLHISEFLQASPLPCRLYLPISAKCGFIVGPISATIGWLRLRRRGGSSA